MIRWALALLLVSAAPASAAEVFAGVFTHGASTGLTLCCFERGQDVQLGAMTGPIKSFGRWGDLHLFGLVSANTAGGVSFASAGLTLRVPLSDRLYFEPGLGAAVQNGSTLPYQATPNRLYLGSRLLFEPQAALGYALTPDWAVEGVYVHLSHAQLASPQNPGLDDFGVRLVYRFGG